MMEKLLRYPGITAKLLAMKGDVYRKVGELTAEAAITDEPLPKEKWKDAAFAPFDKGKCWTKTKYGCCVFRFRGKVPAEAKGKKTVALLKLGAEAEVYRDGLPVCGVTPIMATIDVGQPLLGKQVVPLFDGPDGGEDIVLEADCGHNGYCGVFLYDPRLVRADIAVVNEEIKDYYYDCLALYLTLATEGKNEYLTPDGVKEIKDAFDASYGLYKKGDVCGARKTLAPFFEGKQTEGVEYVAIGHGHLDLAWKWPIREGIRKAVRTFSNAVAYLDKYDYVFGASQAQMFRWVEETEPELFGRVKEKVASGGMEIQGGMWTECDCNIPCGESLIRQFLYGEKYFLSRFGRSSDVVWLPDVFGFPATLPQIIRGVGKKYFMTIKLNWNEYTKFPLQSFIWKGPDGSEVIAHIAPEGTYSCSASPLAFVKADVRNVQKETGEALLIYGVSDGGGGPGEGHLEMLKRAGGKYLPKAVASSSESLFRKLESKKLPYYSGELYLEKHQGTLTSQAKNKYYNRLSERKLHNLEWLEAVCDKKCERRDELWQRVLTNQFHDILPGSAINRVHRESVEDYIEVCSAIDNAVDSMIAGLSDGKTLCALNPSPFPVREKFLIGGKLYLAECEGYSSCPLVPTERGEFFAGENRIENEKIRVTFDVKTGSIISVYDKRNGKEYAKKGLFHTPVVYTDPKTRFDAWDIDRKYLDLPKRKPTLVGIGFSSTEERASAFLNYAYNKSVITQEIYVKDSAIIYFDTQTEWNETHKMLRASFTPSVWTDKARFDIQFGSIERSTAVTTLGEKAMYEVCGHYYAAVGDEEQGFVSVMNRGKYGYRVQEGEISLNLLRSPTFPDRTCDKGEQTFCYAAVFAGDEAEVVREGYNYNNPPIIAEGEVKIEKRFGVRAEGVITETVKPAESGVGAVVRAYERFGKAVKGEFVTPDGYEVFESDMLERNERKVYEADFAPHEIKTYVMRPVQ